MGFNFCTLRVNTLIREKYKNVAFPPTTYLLTYSLTYLLTHSMEQSPSWEANGLQLVKKFPAFYGTRRFITAFTSANHLSLSWASSVQSITHILLLEHPSYYYSPIYAWVSPEVSFLPNAIRNPWNSHYLRCMELKRSNNTAIQWCVYCFLAFRLLRKIAKSDC
jgi:hypothetical protein